MDKYFKMTLLLSLFAHLFVLTMVYVPDIPVPTNIIDLEVTFGQGLAAESEDNEGSKDNKVQFASASRDALAFVPPIVPATVGSNALASVIVSDKKSAVPVLKVPQAPERSVKAKAAIDREAAKKLSTLAPAAGVNVASAIAISPVLAQEAQEAKPNINSKAKPANSGHLLGNAKKGKDVGVLRYEMKVSLWLDKFRKYPKAAINQGLEGEGTLFIKIDRRGNVLLAKVKRSTGYILLDNALMQMVKDANPIIPAPEDYFPEKNAFSYEIVFRFNKAEWQE